VLLSRRSGAQDRVAWSAPTSGCLRRPLHDSLHTLPPKAVSASVFRRNAPQLVEVRKATQEVGHRQHLLTAHGGAWIAFGKGNRCLAQDPHHASVVQFQKGLRRRCISTSRTFSHRGAFWDGRDWLPEPLGPAKAIAPAQGKHAWQSTPIHYPVKFRSSSSRKNVGRLYLVRSTGQRHTSDSARLGAERSRGCGEIIEAPPPSSEPARRGCLPCCVRPLL